MECRLGRGGLRGVGLWGRALGGASLWVEEVTVQGPPSAGQGSVLYCPGLGLAVQSCPLR